MVNANIQPQTEISAEQVNTPIAVTPHDHSELELQEKYHLIQLYGIKAVTGLLILQGLWSLFNSIKFIFFELPNLEQQLHLGQINDFQVNAFANKAIIMTISTILSLFFALRITVLQSKAAKTISITLAILLVIGNTQINNFLNQIDSSQLITSTIIETLRSVLSF
ncbi:MAG: hypothetical protein HN846_02570 [Candidatus Pacebacteria bacterium]|jgi:hypothetical protein|nr:hypothetical protein [Candidatus Paceibacterota bacterium]MBT3511745.1 hypothetical protein [Candidatus Paceibacterota bacterium]MBT4005170.1 hypothetical protein [Candidatus Paceibacterota bacterium]MBT4358996.1 hypothetical protein [Candidatus Paceibacterota bacterium]MBT4681271.1 hypothetical protein [Candidatus Paceibacterota bacterium]